MTAPVKMAAKAEPLPVPAFMAEPAFVPTAGGGPVELIEVIGGAAMTEAEARKLE